MTGYGALKKEVQGMRVSVEIKSLNSKYLELNLKLPRQYNHKE
ncbi:MAG TPA: YicC/YloC family endoribonuclease, partial [Anseongella sp.]